MQALDFLLPQPPFELSAEQQAAFEALIPSFPEHTWLDYHLPYPKWQFLSYLCNARNWVLYGSPSLNLREIDPQITGRLKASYEPGVIYATIDGIWAIYFATISNKNFHHLFLLNSCWNIRPGFDSKLVSWYFFSVTRDMLNERTWGNGAVYILPRSGFNPEAAYSALGTEITIPHWTSSVAAEPVAKLYVQPQDFPFFSEIHPRDNELSQPAGTDPNDLTPLGL